MRFYVPEWEDSVDASYDFVHDEHSALDPAKRDLAYIWDIFDYESTPIDGVLISREQVEESPTKFDRITTHGIYDDPRLDLPSWIPTISDCGAWGYKRLPFPPYGNRDMLEFYETLDVDVGVTIDHLVLGSGHTSRLYLDDRAFTDEFTPADLPGWLRNGDIDVMTDTWPREWPEYVSEYNPTLEDTTDVPAFTPTDFKGSPRDILTRLKNDSRAVYREDDTEFRYELTLENAAEMYDLYEAGEYAFRLMVAIQGWDPDSYQSATETVLDLGYQSIGIGGVAGSGERTVKRIVTAVGNAVKHHERTYRTRVDTHVFGFAKTGAFGTIGRSGMTSFDSASMLRSAWTGGDNYQLASDYAFDALRIRYPPHGQDIATSIEWALRAQEVLVALRAFDADESISEALRSWQTVARTAIENLPAYLREHRHDAKFDHSTLRPIERAFRDEFEYARELKASFSDDFRTRVIKLLREDSPEAPLSFTEYDDLVQIAASMVTDREPTLIDDIERREREGEAVGTLKQVWGLVESYARFAGDADNLDEYQRLLRAEPWKECDCTICQTHGIEVAIWRGNNRNRRRGFHNTRRFYDQFERELPKLMVLVRGSSSLPGYDTIEEYLREEHDSLWTHIHDLPVAEIGVITASGVHEWWESPPRSISLDPFGMKDSLEDVSKRYQEIHIDARDWTPSPALTETVEATSATIQFHEHPPDIRSAVLERLNYADSFVPDHLPQSGLTEF